MPKSSKKKNKDTVIQVDDVDLADMNNGRLDALRKEADEITDLMHGNLIKIRDREGKIDHLMVKAEGLRASAEVFETTSRKLKTRYFWQNRRFLIIAVALVIFVLLLAIVLITLSATGHI